MRYDHNVFLHIPGGFCLEFLYKFYLKRYSFIVYMKVVWFLQDYIRKIISAIVNYLFITLLNMTI